MNDSHTRLATHHQQIGFTLMEVLGAIAILGISYTMLATSSIDGLRLIGESTRRSDASLLADSLLADIELMAEIGQPIYVGFDELEEEPFTIVVEILDLAEEFAGSSSDVESKDLLEFLAAEANGPFSEFRDSNWLLGYLREVHISVQWQEGAKEITVSRTAYIYDQRAWMETQLNQGEQKNANSGDPSESPGDGP
ncbi:MAG: prepilin-type N-terminal cleavage/methylation domain-containing protein [Myxococcales bacterium]|nr:prepilin-type N-terminal cleavage/methylation domain-containing protein [Myxococcales bacterium]